MVKTNDEGTLEEQMVTIYEKRGGIENFLKGAIFLNLDKLPGTELNSSNACNKTRRILHCKLLKKRYWRRLR